MKDRIICPSLKNEQVRTALLLAAGTGSRLAPLTDLAPKCLVPVNEISILERLVDSLKEHNFNRLVIVVGHQADCIRNFLGTRSGGMEITYIVSPLYKTTNNIYSLWLARKIIDEPFLLIESDLVFDPKLLKGMLCPDRIAVGKSHAWMNGTTVTINNTQKVDAFHCGAHNHDDNHYKTVNIYSLSSATWQLVRERLESHISNNLVNGYYETVFADMVDEGSLSFSPVFFDCNRWYEIDTISDLRIAEKMPGLRHRPFVTVTDHVAGKPKVHKSPAFNQLKTDVPFKKAAFRQSDRKVSKPRMSAVTLPQ
ncbi:MAG: phosphocholine cytidylyltransferase family protein [Desulfobulbaceae bacterium]|uniref:Phosphocholine cytidylyltransferase family protein n=1 Tax=Candidatus Desulfatifera sulfidica TaxID=2841691 RepID=A0A8J6NB22_9BACT|nr:phosphocholine cytidylyltransferase family protein [Candidatus Desulfatifera sulfidica]